MSLRDAITEITADMETEDHPSLKSYAKQLRRVLKATEGEPAPTTPAINPMAMLGMMPGFGAEAQHAVMVEKARQEARAQRKALGLLEGYGEGQIQEGQTLVQLSGGPLDGTVIPAPSGIPVGNKTAIDGHVYRIEKANCATYVPNEGVQQSSTLIIP